MLAMFVFIFEDFMLEIIKISMTAIQKTCPDITHGLGGIGGVVKKA